VVFLADLHLTVAAELYCLKKTVERQFAVFCCLSVYIEQFCEKYSV